MSKKPHKHESWELKQLQCLPLKIKLKKTKRRIQEWYEHWDGEVYVSFSGGKDSTVLRRIVKRGKAFNLTGVKRTGCVFYMFGCHLEKTPNRFQLLKHTHPKLYDYCIGGGGYTKDGIRQPSKNGLGLSKILDYIGVKY